MLWYSGRGFPFVMPPEDGDALADWFEAEYPDEFCASSSFDPDFVDTFCAAGFIPMAAKGEDGSEYLIPKLHILRSVLDPCDVSVTRTARRESSRYTFRLDSRFDEVLEACVATHGEDWLRPPLLTCWRELFATRDSRLSRFASMELYEADRLVAGEVGVFSGACYTSLTGFKRVSGSGTVQLAALARYLEAAGVRLWDLGMPLDYKATLGARNVSRSEFLTLFRAARGANSSLRAGFCLPASFGLRRSFPARELIDRGAVG
jgi:leucyl/phenylalanyl-tRNA--protein transferase